MAGVRYESVEARDAARKDARERKSAWLKTTEGREFQLRARMKSLYGITLEDYHAMLKAQNGLCKICLRQAHEGTHGKLYVDHCHSTGRIRGLLCNRCNIGVGNFSDCTETLERALAYLREDS